MRSPFVARALLALLAVVGLLLLLQSPTLGQDATSGAMRAAGGSMDTAQYLVLLESYIAGYRLAGGVLLAVGLVFALQR